ncbi:hypothetical protein [Marinactinospora rubrisoli]|uniref:Class I SAM-dependent methyltransferase n=1 Tax=Marinactinospora rubrisoli TaxID=2715399 RepID=A0ABW2KFR6_9ACTN
MGPSKGTPPCSTDSLDPPTFACEYKSAAAYLDLAANAHGAEKGHLVHRALERIPHDAPQVVEVGPGGGAAISFLAAQLARDRAPGRSVHLTLIEAPGVASQALAQAMEEFAEVGACTLTQGLAQDIGALLPQSVDVIAASALLHEVYSYGGGYRGLHAMMRTLPTVLNPDGFFAYRDVYAVQASSLHERVVQSYGAQSWLQFLRMFIPQYLNRGIHPYHHHDDEILARQNSRIIPIEELGTHTSTFVAAPVGMFREIQRHYITFRDHVWRSGALGFTPILEGQLSHDWIDLRAGHKRVHYRFTETDWLSLTRKGTLLAISEPYADHYTIDGDIFDEVTEVALTAFLVAVEQGDVGCAQVWSSWLEREGRETYAYLTIDELLTAFAVNSIESDNPRPTVLMPAQKSDILRKERNYYNRFLAKRVANPLIDAKQLVLFQNISLADGEKLDQALEAIQGFCSKPNLARIYAAVNSRR